jgi:hypothetical protein
VALGVRPATFVPQPQSERDRALTALTVLFRDHLEALA